MSLDLQEQEQLANAQAFFARWGKPIMGIAAVAGIAFAASQGWNWYQNKQVKSAADDYHVWAVKDSKKDAGAAALLAQLQKNYPATMTTSLASIKTANEAITKGDLAMAKQQAQWVMDHGGLETAGLGHLLMADILEQEGKSDQALLVVTDPKQADYQYAFANKRFDLLLGLGQKEKARQELTSAIALLTKSATPDPELKARLEQKLKFVGGVTPTALAKDKAAADNSTNNAAANGAATEKPAADKVEQPVTPNQTTKEKGQP